MSDNRLTWLEEGKTHYPAILQEEELTDGGEKRQESKESIKEEQPVEPSSAAKKVVPTKAQKITWLSFPKKNVAKKKVNISALHNKITPTRHLFSVKKSKKKNVPTKKKAVTKKKNRTVFVAPAVHTNKITKKKSSSAAMIAVTKKRKVPTIIDFRARKAKKNNVPTKKKIRSTEVTPRILFSDDKVPSKAEMDRVFNFQCTEAFRGYLSSNVDQLKLGDNITEEQRKEKVNKKVEELVEEGLPLMKQVVGEMLEVATERFIQKKLREEREGRGLGGRY